MAFETQGTVVMRDDSGRGVPVRVLVAAGYLRLVSGEETIGVWDLDTLGIHALNDGFMIRAEGEELVLRTEDDAGLAEELGLLASTPRMARKVAASHPPADRPEEVEEAPQPPSRIAEIAFALGGVLVFAGGILLRSAGSSAALDTVSDYWLPFSLGGILMAAVAYLLARRMRGSRVIALLVLAAVIVVFGISAQHVVVDTDRLISYGFIAGGVVVGVVVAFSGSLGGQA